MTNDLPHPTSHTHADVLAKLLTSANRSYQDKKRVGNWRKWSVEITWKPFGSEEEMMTDGAGMWASSNKANACDCSSSSRCMTMNNVAEGKITRRADAN